MPGVAFGQMGFGGAAGIAGIADGSVLKAVAGAFLAAVAGTDYVAPAGVAGGQQVAGGTGAGQHLTLISTTDPTKGQVRIGSATGLVYDGASGKVGINCAAPATNVRVLIQDTGAANNCLEAEATATSGVGGIECKAASGVRGGYSARGTAATATILDEDAAGAVVFSAFGSGCTKMIVGPQTSIPLLVGTNNKLRLKFLSGADIASSAGAVWDAIDVKAWLINLTGSTNVTTALGFNLAVLRAPTITTTVVVTNAATLVVAGPPAAAGGGSITNPYSFWVQSGVTRIDSQLVFGISSIGISCTTVECLRFSTSTVIAFVNIRLLGGGVASAVNPCPLHMGNDTDTGISQPDGVGTMSIIIDAVEGLRVKDPADGEVALLVRRNVGGTKTLERVSMDAADSAGTGFKALRVPN